MNADEIIAEIYKWKFEISEQTRIGVAALNRGDLVAAERGARLIREAKKEISRLRSSLRRKAA